MQNRWSSVAFVLGLASLANTSMVKAWNNPDPSVTSDAND